MDARVRFRGDEAVKGKRFMYYAIGLFLLILVGAPLVVCAGCVGLFAYSRHAAQQESIAAARARVEADERARQAEAESRAKAAADERQWAEAEAKREQARRDAEALLQRAAELQRIKAEEERRRAEADAARTEAIARAEREERQRKADIVNTIAELEATRQALPRDQKDLEEANRVVKLVEDAKISTKPDGVIELPRDKFEYDANNRPTKYIFYTFPQKDKALARVTKERDSARQNLDKDTSTIRELEARLKTLQAADKK
jgi:hypothetical protein